MYPALHIRKVRRHDVSAYTINPTTGALTEIDQNGATAGTTVPAVNGPTSVTVDSSGKFAFVAKYNTTSVATYTIDTATGALTSGSEVASGNGPRSVTTTGTIQ